MALLINFGGHGIQTTFTLKLIFAICLWAIFKRIIPLLRFIFGAKAPSILKVPVANGKQFRTTLFIIKVFSINVAHSGIKSVKIILVSLLVGLGKFECDYLYQLYRSVYLL